VVHVPMWPDVPPAGDAQCGVQPSGKDPIAAVVVFHNLITCGYPQVLAYLIKLYRERGFKPGTIVGFDDMCHLVRVAGKLAARPDSHPLIREFMEHCIKVGK